MEKNAGNFLINNPLYFRNKVKNGGDWDLKNTPEYKSNFYGNGFIFKDKHIISDAPGNIHYGYVGAAALWTSPDLLAEKAGEANVVSGNTDSHPEWKNIYFHGDDPVDQVNMLWGIDLYYNR